MKKITKEQLADANPSQLNTQKNKEKTAEQILKQLKNSLPENRETAEKHIDKTLNLLNQYQNWR